MACVGDQLFQAALKGNVHGFHGAFSELSSEKTAEEVESLLLSVDKAGNTILHHAVLGGHLEMVHEFLTKQWFLDDANRNRDIRVKWLKTVNKAGNKPLKLAQTSPRESSALQPQMLADVGRKDTSLMLPVVQNNDWGPYEDGWRDWLDVIEGSDFSGPVLMESRRWMVDLKLEQDAHQECNQKLEAMVSKVVRSATERGMLETMCQIDNGGPGLLHLAAREGNAPLLQGVLQLKDRNLLESLLGMVDKEENNVLHHAVLGGQSNAVDVLLNKTPTSNKAEIPNWNVRWMTQKNADRKTPLNLAIGNSRVKGQLLGSIGLTYTGTELSAVAAAIKYEKWRALKTWSEIITADDFNPLKDNTRNILHHLASKRLTEQVEPDGSDTQCYLAQTVIRNVIDKLKKQPVAMHNLHAFMNHKANGRLPVHDAARNANDFLIVTLDEEREANMQKSILDEKDVDDNNILHHAVQLRRVSTLKVLFRQRWQKHQQQQQQEWDEMILKWFSTVNKNKKTPLHLLLEAGGYGPKILTEIKHYLLNYTSITVSNTEELCHILQCATAMTATDEPIGTPPDPLRIKQRSRTCEQANASRKAIVDKLAQLVSRVDANNDAKLALKSIKHVLLQISKVADKTCNSIQEYRDLLEHFPSYETGDVCEIITEHTKTFLWQPSTTESEAEYYMKNLAKFSSIIAECDLSSVDFQEVAQSLFPLSSPVTVEVALRLEYLSSMLTFLRQDEYRHNLLHWRELQRIMKCVKIMQDALPQPKERNTLVDKLIGSLNELLRVEEKVKKVRLIVNQPNEGKSPMEVLMGPTGNPKMLQDMLELGIECEEKELGHNKRNILHTAADIGDLNILTKYRDYFQQVHELETKTDIVYVEEYLTGVATRLSKISQDTLSNNYIQAVNDGKDKIRQELSNPARSTDHGVPIEGTAKRFRDTVLQKDHKGETALHIAVRQGFVNHVKMLMGLWKNIIGSNGLNDLLNVKDGKGRVPFLSSAAGGAVASALFLLRTDGTRHIYAQDDDGKNALTIAMENGHVTFVKMLLLQAEGEGKALHDFESKLNENRVITKAHQGQENEVDETDGAKSHKLAECQVVDERYRNEVFNSVDINFRSVIHHAVINQKEDMLRVLLESGAKECLLKKGSEKDQERTPYLWAVKTGNLNMVKKIYGTLRAQGKLKFVASDCDKDYNTAGHIAAESGYLHIIKYLNGEKNNLLARNKESKTPLEVATEHGQLAVLKYLVEDCHQLERDINISKSLLRAIEKGHQPTVQYLLNLEDPAIAGVVHIVGKSFNLLESAISERNGAMANGILTSVRRNEVLNDMRGRSTPFQKLLKYMPEVADTLLNQYIRKDEEGFLVDYSLLDERSGSIVPADVLLVTVPGSRNGLSESTQIVVPAFRRDTAKYLEERLQKEWNDTITVKGSTGTVTKAPTSNLRYQIQVNDRQLDAGKVEMKSGYHLRLANLCIGLKDDSSVGDIESSILRAWKEGSDGKSFVAVFDKDGNRANRKDTMPKKGFQLLINGQKFYMDPARHRCYQCLPDYFRCVTKTEVGMMAPVERKSHHPLQLLIDSGHDKLIQHPVSVSCIKHYWDANKIIYYATSVIMLLYSVALTLNVSGQARKQSPSDCVSACGLASDACLYTTMAVCLLVAALGLIREVLQCLENRLGYLNIDNVVDVISYIMTIIVVPPYTWQYKHLVGAFAVLITCLNTLFYMRALPVLGIFISMLRNILKTILRYCPVLLALILIFAACFHIVMHKLTPFGHYATSAVTMYVMMTGELEYSDRYLPSEDGDSNSPSAPEHYAGLSLLIVFITIMSIIVANLLIGLTVCDVSDLTSNAQIHILRIKGQMILDGLFNNVTNLFRHWYVHRNPHRRTESTLTIPVQYNSQRKGENRCLHWFNRTFATQEINLTKKSIGEKSLQILASSEKDTTVEPEPNRIIDDLTARISSVEVQLKQLQPSRDAKETEVDTQMFAPHGGQLYRQSRWHKLYQTDSLDSMLTLLYIDYKQSLDFSEYLDALDENPVVKVLKDGLERITGSIGSWTDARLVWMEKVHGSMDTELSDRSCEKKSIFGPVMESVMGRLTPDEVAAAPKCSRCKASPTHTLGAAEVIEAILKDKVEDRNAYQVDLESILNDPKKKVQCKREATKKGKTVPCTGYISYTFQVTDSPMLLCVQLGDVKLRRKYRIKLRDLQSELILTKPKAASGKTSKERFARYELAMVTILSENPRRYWSVIKVGDSWWRHDPKLLMQKESCRAKRIPPLEEKIEPKDEKSYINYVVYRKDVSWLPDKR